MVIETLNDSVLDESFQSRFNLLGLTSLAVMPEVSACTVSFLPEQTIASQKCI